jgi:hypothetical protein
MNNSEIFDLVASSILFLTLLVPLILLIIHYRKLDKQDSQHNPA